MGEKEEEKYIQIILEKNRSKPHPQKATRQHTAITIQGLAHYSRFGSRSEIN